MDGTGTIDPTGFIKSRSLKFPKDGTYLTGKVRGLLRAGDYERELVAAALKATRAEDVVLDLGCGPGRAAALMQAAGHTVLAYAATPEFVAQARA